MGEISHTSRRQWEEAMEHSSDSGAHIPHQTDVLISKAETKDILYVFHLEIHGRFITERRHFGLSELSSGKYAHPSNYRQPSFSPFTFHAVRAWAGTGWGRGLEGQR